jgi:hypothetical protein
MLPLQQAAWLGCGNVDVSAVPPSFALRHRGSRNPRFRCVGGCRDDSIKVLVSWHPDFGSDVEIPLNNGRDGVGDRPDILVRSANCRLGGLNYHLQERCHFACFSSDCGKTSGRILNCCNCYECRF